MDHQVWEDHQEVFDKSLFLEELSKLRVMSYDDLEKAILLVQEVFCTLSSSFVLN